MVRERCQQRSKRLCKTDGLEYDAAQLPVQGRVVIGLEVLLIPDSRRGDQTAVSQTAQLSLHAAGAGLRELDDLVGEKTALRLTEQQRKNPLLSRREQRIDQTCPDLWAGPAGLGGFFAQAGRFDLFEVHAHCGHFNAQNGHLPASLELPAPGVVRDPGFALFFPRFPPLRLNASFGKLRRVMINHAVIIEAMEPANIPFVRSYSM